MLEILFLGVCLPCCGVHGLLLLLVILERTFLMLLLSGYYAVMLYADSNVITHCDVKMDFST